MWRQLLAICFAISSFITYGQTVFNYDNPDFRSKPGYLHVTADSSVFLTGMSWNDFMYGIAGVYRTSFNENSSIELTEQLEGYWGEYPEELSIYGLNNGDFILAARLTGCDYGVPLTVGIFDSDGMPYFNPFHVSLNSYVKPKISLRSDGEFDKLIAISDPFNTLLMTYEGEVLLVEEVLAYDAQIELKTGYLSANGPIIELQDSQFNTLISTEFTEHIVAIDTLANGYFVITDSVYILDEHMDRDFKMKPDSTIAYGIATSTYFWLIQDNGFIHRLTDELEEDTIFQLPFTGSISDVKHVGDIIHMTGLYQTPYEQSRFHVRTDQDAFLEGALPDVELIDVRIADTVRTHIRPWGVVDYLDIDYGRVYVTLHNKGNIPIQRADIKMSLPHCPGICSGAYELTYELEGLSLGPDDIREYFLDELSFQCAAFQPEQLCMWVVAPNHMPDLNPVEVPICAEVDFITGTHRVPANTDIKVWPNPSHGDIYVQSDINLSSFEVVNSLGQTVLSGDLRTEPYHIDMSSLDNGTYMIIIEDSNRNFITERTILMR